MRFETYMLRSENNDIKIRIGQWEDYEDTPCIRFLRESGAMELVVTNTIFESANSRFTIPVVVG